LISRIVEKVQSKILRPVYEKHFSIFCSIASASWSKVSKSTYRTPQKIFLKENNVVKKTHNSRLLSNHQKIMQEKL